MVTRSQGVKPKKQKIKVRDLKVIKEGPSGGNQAERRGPGGDQAQKRGPKLGPLIGT